MCQQNRQIRDVNVAIAVQIAMAQRQIAPAELVRPHIHDRRQPAAAIRRIRIVKEPPFAIQIRRHVLPQDAVTIEIREILRHGAVAPGINTRRAATQVVIAVVRIEKQWVGADIALTFPAAIDIAVRDQRVARSNVDLVRGVVPQDAVGDRRAAVVVADDAAADVTRRVAADRAADDGRLAVVLAVHARTAVGRVLHNITVGDQRIAVQGI